MADVYQPPCDEAVIQSGTATVHCQPSSKPWVLAATILGSSMVFINGSTVNVALPALQTGLGASVVEVQWIVNAYTLFLAALILIGGSLGDHLGRKRVFLWGVLLFSGASVWCGLALNSSQLILARAVQGVGGALLTPGSLTIISAVFPRQERGQAIGLWSGFSAITAALGPVLGGWLIESFSWRWIFFINLPLALAVLLISIRHVPESRDEEALPQLDWGGALLAILGLGGVTYGLLESSNRGLTDPLVLLAVGIGLISLIAFLYVEAHQPTPMVPLGLFKSSTFSGANGLTLLLYAALGGALFFFPFNLIQVQGYSATAAGAAFLPFILLLSLLSRWSGGLVDRFGAKLPLVVGPIIAAAGFALFCLPGIGGSYWATFFPAVFVLGLGMAVSVAPLTTTVMNSVPEHQSGTASGINNAVSRVAGLLAIAALGIVMVIAFNNRLDMYLAPLDLSGEVTQALASERSNLAGAQVPSGLGQELTHQIERAIDTSFIFGFRVVMLIAAGLALASAAVAGLTIQNVIPEGR